MTFHGVIAHISTKKQKPNKYNTRMNKEEIKQKFLDEIAQTEKRIAEYQELTKPVAPDVAIGRVSRMDANQQQIRY